MWSDHNVGPLSPQHQPLCWSAICLSSINLGIRPFADTRGDFNCTDFRLARTRAGFWRGLAWMRGRLNKQRIQDSPQPEDTQDNCQ